MAIITVVGEVVVDRVRMEGGYEDVGGGSAANTALALARAGDRVELRARYSTDSLGQYLRNITASAGISLQNAVAAKEPATLVEVTMDRAGVPEYRFHMEGTADWQWSPEEISRPLPEGTQAVIIGSLVTVLEPSAHVLLDWAKSIKSESTLLCFDPNARPTVLEPMGLADTARALIEEWVQVADIVKVSDEDMRWIAPDQSPLVVAAEWSTRGPKLVVLTEGSQGVVAYAHGKLVCVLPGVSVDVSDTVGAGDTFMAWLVRGYVELPVEEREESFGLVDVIAMANHAAALNCTQRGCNPPSHRDVRKFYLYTNH